jgi:hypothetical protein
VAWLRCTGVCVCVCSIETWSLVLNLGAEYEVDFRGPAHRASQGGWVHLVVPEQAKVQLLLPYEVGECDLELLATVRPVQQRTSKYMVKQEQLSLWMFVVLIDSHHREQRKPWR